MVDNINDLCERLHISTWDALLIGDGSGTGWYAPGGWAGVLMWKDRETGIVHMKKPIIGGCNRASINLMEAMPYWLLLKEFDHEHKDWTIPIHVHIVTDSQYVANMLANNGKAHADVQQLFRYYEQHGYRLYWHHAHRGVISLNTYVDQLAAVGRSYLMSAPLPEARGVFNID